LTRRDRFDEVAARERREGGEWRREDEEARAKKGTMAREREREREREKAVELR
jgi:hypothetical protein